MILIEEIYVSVKGLLKYGENGSESAKLLH